jgi:hypothetical protein
MDPFWKSFLQKILSRKFLLALAAFVAVTLATFGATYADEVADAIVKIGGALLDLLIVLGYIRAEASVDRARVENGHGAAASE